MKKNTLKAFTLVEMLIVIVIIGILIAALLPRMQAAQGRARDVSRKTALSQIQSAIVTYQGDFGRWPGCTTPQSCTSGNSGMAIESISSELTAAGMNGIPKDPLGSSVGGLGSGDKSHYAYLVMKRNGTDNGGFALMAKTEVAGGSNWVVCDSSMTGAPENNGNGKIESTDDLKNITLCQSIEKDENATTGCIANTGSCKYTDDSQLRYLITY